MLPVSFEIRPLDVNSWPPAGCACLGCGSRLDWSQPSSHAPDRLLGACSRCGEWHLLEVSVESRDALLALLPGGGRLRERPGDRPRMAGAATAGVADPGLQLPIARP